MKVSFQSLCITTFVVMIHIAVIAGFSNLTDQPNQFFADIDGEAILEELFGEEHDHIHVHESETEATVPDNPLHDPLIAEGGATVPVEDRNEPEFVDRQEESDEVSAIVDARLLSGRIDAPNPGSYVREPDPEKEEPAVRAEPVQNKPEEVEPVQEKEAKTNPAPEQLGGPRRIRSIRPI